MKISETVKLCSVKTKGIRENTKTKQLPINKISPNFHSMLNFTNSPEPNFKTRAILLLTGHKRQEVVGFHQF